MTVDLLVRNALITTSTRQELGTLAIDKGKFLPYSGQSAREEIDATGLVAIPGVIDTQVHFREPGMEHKEDLESGTRAAILGGVTTIFEMPNTNPTTTTEAALLDKLARAAGRAWCDYSFFVGATTENISELAHLETLPGSPGIKIFMGSSTGPLLVGDDEHLRRVLQHGTKRCPIHAEDEPRNRERKLLLSDHPHPREHPFLRDATSARIATERILALSEQTGRPVHILHVSTADELPILVLAKENGASVTCEVTPQHLWFQAPECYEKLGTLAQMNPPIRAAEHRAAIRDALKSGLFDVFGSDHAPHTLEEKSQPYPTSPSGMPGVQTLLPILLTLAKQEVTNIHQIVKMACERPAELYGISDKGSFEADADLVLVDPDASYVFERSMVASKCGWSPYEGETFTGQVKHVLLRGRPVVAEGELVGPPSGEPVRFNWK